MNKREICGIYKITSPSNRVYIGQSENIHKRWKGYNCESAVKGQIRIYQSLKKYGVENHIFEIIEECEFLDLNKRERYWQDFYDVLGPKGMNCYLTETDELPRKFSKERNLKISKATKGRKRSPETIAKIAAKSRGRKRTEEQRLAMIGRNKGNENKKSKLVLDLEMGIYYDCVREAAEALCRNYSSLRSSLQGCYKSRTRFIYAFEEFKLKEKPPRKKINHSLGKNPNAKLVINIETGIFYDTIKEAAESINMDKKQLASILKRKENETPFRHA